MNINTNSWHYKWLQFWAITLFKWYHVWRLRFLDRDNEEVFMPKSLCLYVNAIWVLPPMVGFFFFYASVGAIVGFTVFFTLVVPIRWSYRLIRRPRVKDRRGDQPSIAWEYVKARKKSVCPVLTYTEN